MVRLARQPPGRYSDDDGTHQGAAGAGAQPARPTYAAPGFAQSQPPSQIP